MEALKKRNIQDGGDYENLFPPAALKDETVKKGATVSDTVKFIPKVVERTLGQTEKIAQRLKGNTLVQTCKNIWHFVYNHIAYSKDKDGVEQIRAPARSWHDRKKGVDCDCYTVFISSILTNLGIPHILRIAKYKKPYFQHIYPIVPKSDGSYITIDCVTDYFNYEEPYKEIQDTKMDLEYLSGTDEQDGFGQHDEDLGKLKLKLKKLKLPKIKLGKILKNGLHAINRINPATLLLRTGVLASMKLNIFKVAQRLKYSYLTEEQAKKKGINLDKYHHLVKVREKIDKILYGAGGKPENMKKAILTGKGNKHHEVSGLGYIYDDYLNGMDENTPLSELLGDIYHSELEGLEGLGELGEPATAASLSASSSVLALLAGLLKKIGNIFEKKDAPEAGDFDEAAQKSGDEASLPAEIAQNKDELEKMDDASKSDSDSSSSSSTAVAKRESSDSSDSSESEDEGSTESFWDKNKKWLKPTMWGVGGITVLTIAYKAITGHKQEQRQLPPAPLPQNPQMQLSGTGKKKKPKYKSKKKKEVALM
jgi:hypothetical protein